MNQENTMVKTIFTAVLLTFVSSMNIFANDVEVVFSRGDVLVTGDSDANDLEIRRIAGNIHQFRGLGGTTVNGASDPVILPIQDDLKIWMLGGNDFVNMRNLYLRSTSHADLIIEMGRGDDELLLDNGSVRRNVVISDDGVFRGNDTLTLRYLKANTVDIETQGSADVAVVLSSVNQLFVESGLDGQDLITLVSNQMDLVDVKTSDENDQLFFIDNDVAGGFLRVNLGGGNDSAKLSLNTLNDTDARFDGGDDFDSISGTREYQGPFWWWWRNVRFPNFESGF